MKKSVLSIALFALSFGLGFGLHRLISPPLINSTNEKKVSGIGGVFFKCKNPAMMRAWYKTNLGLHTNPYGAVFEWYQGADSTKKGYTTWSVFNEKTKYFEPSAKDFMINYRVENLDMLAAELRVANVTFTDSIQVFDYGKFVHVLDPEGNKIELWEPNDVAYEKLGKQLGSTTTK